MHRSKQVGSWWTTGRATLAAFLILGLGLVWTGCGGSGANGDDGGGEEEPSASVSAPSGLTATSGAGEVSLDWEAVEGAESYSVYRSTSSGTEVSGSALEGSVSSAEYTDATAENGTTYYYRVTAVGADDSESGASDEVEVTPFAEPPSRP